MKKSYLVLLLLIIVFGFYLYSSNMQRYFSPVSSYWDPLDTDHEYFTVGRFPDGHGSVSIFTIDDVSYASSTQDVRTIKEITSKYGASITFFVIPRYGGEDRPLSENQEIVDYLEYCISTGDEVAMHGYTHYPTKELEGKSYDEQREILEKGLLDLSGLFGPINGFRPPSFWKNTNTYKALADIGFEYCSSASIFNVFPYHPKDYFHPLFGDDIDIIEVPCFPEDYFWDVRPDNLSILSYELTTRYESCEKKGTAFVVLSHLDRLVQINEISGRSEGLLMLDNYLEYVYGENAWMPTLTEYVRWYKALGELDINSRNSQGVLTITIESENEVSGLTLYMDLTDDIDVVNIYHNEQKILNMDANSIDDIIIV